MNYLKKLYCNTKITINHQHNARQLLLNEIVSRISKSWNNLRISDKPCEITTTNKSQIEVINEIHSHLQFAKKIGFDIISNYEINERKVVAQAIRMSEAWYELMRDQDESLFFEKKPFYIEEYKSLMLAIGHPPIKSKHAKKWFIKALLKHERRVIDYMTHCLKGIGSNGSQIVSTQVIKSRESQIERQTIYALNHEFASFDGVNNVQKIPFTSPQEFAKSRFAKSYVRLMGLDEWCTGMNMLGFFVTLTLPPEYHPNPKNGNCSWSGATPEDGRIHMQMRWEIFRRRYHEGGGKCYGARVFEPHVDGSIHWHALLYIEKSRVFEFQNKVRNAFGEGVATDIRLIDRSMSAGPSYLIKYLNPSLLIDNECDVRETRKNSKKEKAIAYGAHRATWGGRSIQFFDISSSSTIWDELRRIEASSAEYQILGIDGVKLHAFAKSNKYGDFLFLLSKMQKDKSKRIRVEYELSESNSKKIRGLTIDSVFIGRSNKKWIIQKKANKNQPKS